MVEVGVGEGVEGVELGNMREDSLVHKLRDKEQALVPAREQGKDQVACRVGAWVFDNNSPYRLVRTLGDRCQGRFEVQGQGWGLREEVVLHLQLVELSEQNKENEIKSVQKAVDRKHPLQ